MLYPKVSLKSKMLHKTWYKRSDGLMNNAHYLMGCSQRTRDNLENIRWHAKKFSDSGDRSRWRRQFRNRWAMLGEMLWRAAQRRQ